MNVRRRGGPFHVKETRKTSIEFMHQERLNFVFELGEKQKGPSWWSGSRAILPLGRRGGHETDRISSIKRMRTIQTGKPGGEGISGKR